MKENNFGIFILAQIIVGANVFTGALTNSKFTRLCCRKISMSHHSMQNN